MAEEALQLLEEKKTVVEKSVKQKEEELKQLSTLVNQTEQSRARRENASTSFEVITNSNSSVRYRRRKETENVLSYIHGGKEGAIFGAWDFVAANASRENMDLFIGSYKRGRYLQTLVGNAVRDYNKSEESLKQALALKYSNFLSRRKFNTICKTQTSVFDPEKEIWVPRNMKCAGVDMRVQLSYISNESIDKFVKSLDIGNVNQIPGAPGVTRTLTGLVFMILDLHLKLPYLQRKLVWFNDNPNHFVFQFSDDGAPETSELSMSIGSITLWNLGDRVRSRENQYLLHCVSLPEKHDIMELLWQQHTEEMKLLESSVFNVCQKECTLQFEPAADMSWQSWACNELNQAATYPSPYANVHKANMTTMGGSIGFGSEDMWQPYTNACRAENLKRLDQFVSGLSSGLSEDTIHKKKLAFMAENGMRQLGPPRIGDFAERIRPDPLHCEINAWQNLLDLIYEQAVQRSMFDNFVNVLSAPTKIVQGRLQNNISGSQVDPMTTNPVASRSQTQVNLSPSSLNLSNFSIEEMVSKGM